MAARTPASLIGRMDLGWISFSGSGAESTADFIQAIQRLAFQHDKLKDDTWITEYVSTCFTGDALYWFVDLDEETQGSWKKLRLALTRRFPKVSTSEEKVATGVKSSNVEIPHPSQTNVFFDGRRRTGAIQVVGEYGTPLGYLAFDPSSGIFVTQDEAKAVIVTFPDPNKQSPCHIQMLAIPGTPAAFSFLGLVLCNPNGKAVPDSVSYTGSYSSSLTNVPKVSEPCRLVSNLSIQSYGEPLATWVFSSCTKSKQSQSLLRASETPSGQDSRAMGAVWVRSGTTEDLRLTWLMDNKAEECALNVYVQKQSIERLHLHRDQDFRRVGECLDEEQVDLVFRPSDSPTTF